MISMAQGISAAWHRAGPTRTRLVGYRPRMPEWMKARMRYAKTASANPLLSRDQRISAIAWAVRDLAERGTAEFGTGFSRELARILIQHTDCPRELFIAVVGTYDPDEADQLWADWAEEMQPDPCDQAERYNDERRAADAQG